MPGDAISATPEQWLEVGRRVRQRRIARGLGQDDLVASRSVVSNLEADPPRQQKFAIASLVKIAQALGWTPDSIERIIDGNDPVEAEPVNGEHQTILPPEWEQRWEALEKQLATIRQQQDEMQAEIDHLKAVAPSAPPSRSHIVDVLNNDVAENDEDGPPANGAA